MVTCCDTSFLFSLYGNDTHTPRALAWAKSSSSALSISLLNEYELGNALRFAEFRKAQPPGSAASHLAQFDSDIVQGRVIVEVCNLAQVVADAKRLSHRHTLAGGHRSMDILHVAFAVRSGAHSFLTFDLNQKRLAQAVGLTVPV